VLFRSIVLAFEVDQGRIRPSSMGHTPLLQSESIPLTAPRNSRLGPDAVIRLQRMLRSSTAAVVYVLVRAVDLSVMDHSNICCLNTMLILMVLAHRRGCLAELLTEVDREELVRPHPKLSTCRAHLIPWRRNFREVLWFWQEYYTHRGKDRESLALSSRIAYQEWVSVVQLLTHHGDSGTSLVGAEAAVQLPPSPYEIPPRSSSMATALPPI
jgi:hypothetical protein